MNKVFFIIPARFEPVTIWKTHGRYRKQMKSGYRKHLYSQRNKVETIFSVIRTVWRMHQVKGTKMDFRCIAYNMHRYVKLVVVI